MFDNNYEKTDDGQEFITPNSKKCKTKFQIGIFNDNSLETIFDIEFNINGLHYTFWLNNHVLMTYSFNAKQIYLIRHAQYNPVKTMAMKAFLDIIR